MAKYNSKASVSCLVRCHDGLVMVYERQNGQGTWDIPAGGVEPGETPDEAITRELYEEIGLMPEQQLRLVRIFWTQLAGVPTVHFCYEVTLDKAVAATLSPQDSDIERVAVMSRADIKQIISTNSYEHILARDRLNLYLHGTANTADYTVVQ